MLASTQKFLCNKAKLKQKAANKARKEFNATDRSVLLKKAIKSFNEFIRLRDKNEHCISCGYVGGSKPRQFHAGHYKPAGGYSYLRFDENNVHKQCSICNNHLSGNLVPYRNALILKVGQQEVDRLEQPNQIKKWSVEELQGIIDKYRQLKLGLS